MNVDQITEYLLTYGYWIILLVLFCGIVGIPAPEETFLVFIGMLIAKHQLSFYGSIGSAFAGTLVGMLCAYFIGRKVGSPFVKKFGKYIKITEENREETYRNFKRHGKLSTLLCLFIPGFRQITPYVAGITGFPVLSYLLFATLGSGLWVVLYIIGGYFIGNRIPVEYVSFLGLAALIGFIVVIIVKKRKKTSK
ncbi:DedA family protein [Priestia endophytica]|jgi:membrane-associated protein|uniref:Membrane protein DedA, SNARE-associated domain n=1 Tax=Priestia endophytica DSM 13796 TaxID=1121089 RepID=A0A1I6AI77_9BACI|nr:DedA family protein [Priestia endophytica]KAB2493284.1 DedA family protein [Priestia endophytica]KYG27508.1 alkaline phosphatase [Priestia endophytica]MBG9814349.1 alkaline phosphatase [Priestia endophytica]MED4069833.1 DedA family protein [Priestia endophytica]RAS80140.1 alkaline phosphatase [Priestia endophytica]